MKDHIYCIPYYWGVRKPVRVDGPRVVINGSEIVEWGVYQHSFVEQLAVVNELEDHKTWPVDRTGLQVVGFTASGIEVMLTTAMLRKLPPAPAKQLIELAAQYGDLPTKGTPTLAGNAVTSPAVLTFSDRVVTIHVTARRDLEDLSIAGHADAMEGLFYYSDGDLGDLTPGEGWFIVKELVPLAQNAAARVVDSRLAYDYFTGPLEFH